MLWSVSRARALESHDGAKVLTVNCLALCASASSCKLWPLRAGVTVKCNNTIKAFVPMLGTEQALSAHV